MTVHSERGLLGPTFRSIAAATSQIVGKTELIVVLDSADDRSTTLARQLAHEEQWASVKILAVGNRDLGLSRTDGLNEATGDIVAILDGDDLISENYLLDAVAICSVHADVVCHPQFIVSFGARHVLWKSPSSDDGHISYLDLIEHNQWTSTHVARRELLLQHPYLSLPPASGFGPEDWQWNIDTIARGLKHVAVEDSTMFYRVKASSSLNAAHAHSLLARIPVAQLKAVLPEIRAIEKPSTSFMVMLFKKLFSKMRTLLILVSRRIHPRVKRITPRPLHVGYRKLMLLPPARIHAPVLPKVVLAAARKAVELEPAISWSIEHLRHGPTWPARHSDFAKILTQALEDLAKSSIIIAVPWIGIGGADMVALNYARALLQLKSHAKTEGDIAILALGDSKMTDLRLVPDGVRFVQLPDEWRKLNSDEMQRLLATIVVQIAPEIILSINGFDVTEAMRKYGKQMTARTRIYATLFSWDRTPSGYPANPITNPAERDHLEYLSGIITDNSVTATHIEERVGLDPEKIWTHYQPALVPTPARPSFSRQKDTSGQSETSSPIRAVWPHRFDKEKRPDALIAIARVAKERGLNLQIDAWGSAVLGKNTHLVAKEMERVGIVYRGPYSGGLNALSDLDDYDLLLLTSENEGLPMVVVQAQLLGLPIIASSVGGVVSSVIDEETGLLAEGPEDTSGFVDAIERFIGDRSLRITLAENAYELASNRHSWELFVQRVQEDLL